MIHKTIIGQKIRWLLQEQVVAKKWIDVKNVSTLYALQANNGGEINKPQEVLPEFEGQP